MSQNNTVYERACKDVVFHFNKGHLKDPTIPMWVVKFHGETFYVNHVECELPWSTKETPDNEATKGSLKIKQCHLVIDDKNVAHLKRLTPEIAARLSSSEVIIRVITSYGADLNKALTNVKHVGIKKTGGGCGTLWYITEFNSREEYLMFTLGMPSGTDLRELKPNEEYYKMYEKYKYSKEDYIDDEGYYDDEEDEEDDEEDDVVHEQVNFSSDSYEDLYES